MSDLEWQLGQLREIAEPVGDKWLPLATEKDVPYVGLEHILPENPKIAEYGRSSDVISAKNIFNAGDTLFGKLRPYLKKVALADQSGVCSTDIIPIRANQKADPLFLYYLLSSPKIIAKAVESSAGNVMPRASWSDLADIDIALPPLPEQKKIAEILSGVDRCILHHRARAKKCEDLIAATEERTFEVFRKDDLDQQDRAGRNAKEVIALGDIFDFRNGLNYSKSNTGRGLRVVGVGDFKNYRTPKYDSLGELSPEGLDFDSSLLEEGDFLFVRSNGNRLLIGRCLSIERMPTGTPVVHSGFTIRARPKNQHAYSNVYIKQVLQSRVFRRSVADLGGGTNISNLSQDILSETMIALPSIQRQEKESSGLLAIQGLYEHTQNKLIRLEAMKVAVSSDLLSGRKRVPL